MGARFFIPCRLFFANDRLFMTNYLHFVYNSIQIRIKMVNL